MFKRFSAGFAVGYVLGAKAGEKRYKQISELGEKALDVPAISSLHDRANELFTADNGRQILQALKDRIPLGEDSDGSDNPGSDNPDGDGPRPSRRRPLKQTDRSHRVRDLAHSAIERGRID